MATFCETHRKRQASMRGYKTAFPKGISCDQTNSCILTLETGRNVATISMFHSTYFGNPTLKQELISPQHFASATLDNIQEVLVLPTNTNTLVSSFAPRAADAWSPRPISICGIVCAKRFSGALNDHISHTV